MIRTELSPEAAVALLLEQYAGVMGRRPLMATLALLSAHSAVETGMWRHMYRWNFGNLRGAYRGMTQQLIGADEIIHGRRVTGTAVEKGFRAYPRAEDGARDFLRFLLIDTTPGDGRPNRYQAAAVAAERGEVHEYVYALAAAGYFTASPAIYERGMQALYLQLYPLAVAALGAPGSPASGAIA